TDLGYMPNCQADTLNPNGIALDSQGNVYVANDGPGGLAGTITKFTSNGTYLGVFASGLGAPAAIAFDGSGNLYVVNTASSSVYKITSSGVVSTFVSS